ncbi:MAG: hypothetical protein AAF805_04615 [Planctomycetota bacterium]
MAVSRITTRTLAFALALLAPAMVLAAAAPGGSPIGAGLLDDELAKSLALPGASPPARAPEGGDWLPDDELMNRLLNPDSPPGPPAGEDAGAGPLDGVVSGMNAASGLISDNRVATQATPVQRRVVEDLERLIAQMEKQCQGGSCQGQKKPSEGRQQTRRSQPTQAGQCDKPGDQPGAPKPSQSAAANRSGTTSLGGAGEAGDVTDPEELMKAAWGHLPERVRERMLKGAGGDFLPAYRDELRRYYRRLAEREADPDAAGAP